AVYPRDRAPALIYHRKQIALGLDHVVEIHYDEIGAGLDENFGIEREIGGAPAAPSAAVDEHHDWRVRALGLVDVDLLDLGRPVGDAFRLADDGQRLCVVGGVALGDG